METFVTKVRGQIKIPKRQMSAQAKPVLQKPPPIKFKSVPPPEAKSNELSTLLKVILGVSTWLTLSQFIIISLISCVFDCYHVHLNFNHLITSPVKRKNNPENPHL